MKKADVILHLRLPTGLAPKMESAPKPQPTSTAPKFTDPYFTKYSELISTADRPQRTAWSRIESWGSDPGKKMAQLRSGGSRREKAKMRRSVSRAQARRLWRARKKKLSAKRRPKRKKSAIVLAKTGLRKTKATTVGVWDLGAWSGMLPTLLTVMNGVQNTYRFLTVEATVPVGIIRKKEAVIEWAERQTGAHLSSRDRKEVADNIVAHDFFAVAHAVRKDLGIDYLAGVTPSMIAFTEGNDVYWNFFSTFEDHCILASAYDLRDFAQEAKRPFEVFLAGIILAQMLSMQYWSRGLEFHEQQRNCLFDFNQDRHSLVETARNIHIDPECLKKIGPKSRGAAVALVKLLARYK